MHIAILTFDAFNELDSFIALGILNRIKKTDWKVSIASPTPQVTSMNGLTIDRHITISDVRHADAVIVGSGMKTRSVVANSKLMAELQLDPTRQLLGAQCSGALILAKLGLLDNTPACTDLTTTPWVREAGIEVLDQPLFASGNVATAGGCIASQYLAAWLIAKSEGLDAAKEAIHYVAPVGEKEKYVGMMLDNVVKYL